MWPAPAPPASSSALAYADPSSCFVQEVALSEEDVGGGRRREGGTRREEGGGRRVGASRRVGRVGCNAGTHLRASAHHAASPLGVGGRLGSKVCRWVYEHLCGERPVGCEEGNCGGEVAARAVAADDCSAATRRRLSGAREGNGAAVIVRRRKRVLGRTAIVYRDDLSPRRDGEGASQEVVRVCVALRPATAVKEYKRPGGSVTRAIAPHAHAGNDGVLDVFDGQPRAGDDAGDSCAYETRALCFQGLALRRHEGPGDPLDRPILEEQRHAASVRAAVKLGLLRAVVP